jgi:hypothetical protein
MLGEHEYILVLHNDQEKESYLNNPTIRPHSIIVSGQPYSISKQRNWIRDNLIERDEWFICMDDNIKYLTAIPEPYYLKPRLPKVGGLHFLEINKITFKEFLSLIEEQDIPLADGIGASFIGFASQSNYFFRTNKWKSISLIVSKLYLEKKDELRYNEKILTMDDYEFSIQKMIKCGKVLVNNYIHPIGAHNQAGGLGTLRERGNKKVEDCKLIMDLYPNLLRYKNRKNSLPGGEIVLRFYKEKAFNIWRNNLADFRKPS